jgi:hypothetical protein
MEMSDDQSELERLRAENERLKRMQSGGKLRFKVSEKGAVSVYGLGRFPVTLYKEQWERLMGEVDQLRDFIETNQGQLKLKADKDGNPGRPSEEGEPAAS